MTSVAVRLVATTVTMKNWTKLSDNSVQKMVQTDGGKSVKGEKRADKNQTKIIKLKKTFYALYSELAET